MNQLYNDEKLISLAKDVDSLPPYFPPGYMLNQIKTYGSYEEDGLKFTEKDIIVGMQYSGLAVLVRDMKLYIEQHPRKDANLFYDAVKHVHTIESNLHGLAAFPEYEKLPVDKLPKGLALAADSGQFTIAPMENKEAICHEWTIKPGKRLFNKFAPEFKKTICGKDGPFEQFNNGLLGLVNLPNTIAATIITAGFSAATFWYPLAMYISVLIVKTGLKTYCR